MTLSVRVVLAAIELIFFASPGLIAVRLALGFWSAQDAAQPAELELYESPPWDGGSS